MSQQLLTIQALSDQPTNDRLQPIFDEGWQLRLSSGEELVWHGIATRLEGSQLVGKAWRTSWELKAKTEVLLTNKRLVYVCRKYKKGGAWFGGALAVFFMAIEAAVAAVQRTGKAAVGQVRFEWPLNVIQQTAKLGPMTFTTVTLTCKDASGLCRIELSLPKQDGEQLSEQLTSLIAKSRKEKAERETKSEDRTTTIIYSLPGAHVIGNRE